MSPALLVVALLLPITLWAGADSAAEQDVLRACANPNNLPFSNRQEQGFENQLAGFIAEGVPLMGQALRHASLK